MKIITKFNSPNFSVRTQGIDFLIIHYTEMLFDDALAKLCDSESNVSCHYLIKNNGEVYKIV